MRSSKRLVLLITAAVGLLIWFANTSRFPAINQKASSAGVLESSGALSFDPILEFESEDPYWKKVAYSSVNWANTNYKGMAFGICLSALFLPMLGMMGTRVFQNRYLSTLIGAIAGTPLGLCVNCSAPVATGIYHATRRAEAALALMVSSPTMNVIVITMCFALFPLYMALLKIGLSLLVILLIPAFVSNEHVRPIPEDEVNNACAIPIGDGLVDVLAEESWGQAAIGALRAFGGSLRYVLVRTVPLMLLAGVLGAVAVHALDVGSIMGGTTSFFPLILASLMGTFLPSPMAFDLITAQVMLSAGIAPAYVMTFLFTLGIFSIYSFAIVWKTISQRSAVALYVCVFVIGIGAGYAADAFDRLDQQRTDLALARIFPKSVALHPSPLAQPSEFHASIQPFDIETGREPQKFDQSWFGEIIDVHARSHRTRNTGSGPQFERIEGPRVGIDLYDQFSPADSMPPYRTGRGLASGDFDGDGWVDLAVATDDGIALYRNAAQGKLRFQRVPFPAGIQSNVFTLAFVDINGDGWLDLFASSYREENIFYLNTGGNFTTEHLLRIPGGPESLTKAITFADVDRDGDLDFYLGNWYHPGPTHGTPWVENRNYLMIQNEGSFDSRRLEEISGVTQSALFTDLNGDNIADLVVLNDFSASDFYFLGDGKGGFEPIDGGKNGIPETPRLSMSIDSGDFDNDLLPDLILTNTGGSFESSPLEQRDFSQYCDFVEDQEAKARCVSNVAAAEILIRQKIAASSFDRCEEFDEPNREECLAMALTFTAINRKQRGLCDRITQRQLLIQADCLGFFNHREDSLEHASTPVPQAKQRNVLLRRTRDGRFENVAKSLGAHNTEWSWTARFADLDNDEWQDIYVVNGRWGANRQLLPNVFLHNHFGEFFEMEHDAFGLTDYPVVSGFTAIDFDNDGDLDIVTNAVNAPPRVFVNRETAGHSVTIDLVDHRGNRRGIGSKVYLEYGTDGEKKQFRELKAGGGFVSFDAPVLHFGLGEHETLSAIEVVWSTGDRTRFEQTLPTNHHYRIVRKARAQFEN